MGTYSITTDSLELVVEPNITKHIYIYDHKKYITVGVLDTTCDGMIVKNADNVEILTIPLVKIYGPFPDYSSIRINNLECLLISVRSYINDIEDKHYVTTVINALEAVYGDITDKSLAIPLTYITPLEVLEHREIEFSFPIEKQRFFNISRKEVNCKINLNTVTWFYEEQYSQRQYNIGPLFQVRFYKDDVYIEFNIKLYSKNDFDYLSNETKKGIAVIIIYCRTLLDISSRSVSPYFYRKLELISWLVGTTLNVVVCNKNNSFLDRQISSTVAVTIDTLQKMINEAELENQLFNSNKLHKEDRPARIEKTSFNDNDDALEIVKAIHEYVNSSITALTPMLENSNQAQVEGF